MEFYVNHPFKAVRTADNRLYVEYETGEREYYEMNTDPYQLDSVHGDPENAAEVAELSAQLEALKGCAGDGCRAAENEP